MGAQNFWKAGSQSNIFGILDSSHSFHDPIAKTSVSQGDPSTSLSNASDFDDRIVDNEVELFSDPDCYHKKISKMTAASSIPHHIA